MKKLMLFGIGVMLTSAAFALDDFTLKKKQLALNTMTQCGSLVDANNQLVEIAAQLKQTKPDGAFVDSDFGSTANNNFPFDPNLIQVNSWELNTIINVLVPAYTSFLATKLPSSSVSYGDLLRTVHK